MIYDVRFPAIPVAVRAARRCVARALRGRIDASTLEDVELLASELVSNGVRHAAAGRDVTVGVRIRARADVIRLEVSDSGPGFEPASRQRSVEEEGGWGLYMVDKVSDRWGVRKNGRTAVWFEIDL